MKKNLHGFGLILLMLILGGSFKASADLIVLKLDAAAGEAKTISLVTNPANATIEADWNVLNETPNYPASSSLTNTYDDAGSYTVFINVTGEVTEVSASGQGITTIYLKGMKKLKKLDLSDNKLTDPMDMDANTVLEYLDYSNNGLKEPIKLQLNTALTYLNLSNNALVDPIDLDKNTDLKYLNLSNNKFVDPNRLTYNTALEELDYSDNPDVKGLSVSGLGSLKKVNVSNNAAMKYLDVENCTSLASLNISETSALESINSDGIKNGQITDFVSEGTGLPDDALEEIKDKVSTGSSASYTVSLEVGEGIVSNYEAGQLPVGEGDYLYFEFYPEDINAKAENILFQIDGVTTTFRTSADGSVGTYILNSIDMNHNVVIALKEYTVTMPTIEGLEIKGADKVTYGAPYTFTVSSDTLDLSEMKVFANGEELTANALRAESFSYTIDRVTGPIRITVEGVEGTPTSNMEVTAGYQLSILNGAIQITTTAPQSVAIYGVNGAIKTQQIINGMATIQLAPGFYIVKANGGATKVVVQ